MMADLSTASEHSHLVSRHLERATYFSLAQTGVGIDPSLIYRGVVPLSNCEGWEAEVDPFTLPLYRPREARATQDDLAARFEIG